MNVKINTFLKKCIVFNNKKENIKQKSVLTVIIKKSSKIIYTCQKNIFFITDSNNKLHCLARKKSIFLKIK